MCALRGLYGYAVFMLTHEKDLGVSPPNADQRKDVGSLPKLPQPPHILRGLPRAGGRTNMVCSMPRGFGCSPSIHSLNSRPIGLAIYRGQTPYAYFFPIARSNKKLTHKIKKERYCSTSLLLVIIFIIVKNIIYMTNS